MTIKQKLSNLEVNRLTRESLKNALVSLMKEKDFKNITITELTNKSGVSRVAFYRNYQTKEDILLELSQETVQKVFQLLNTNTRNKAWYRTCFEQIKKYYHMAKLIIVDACIPIQDIYNRLFTKKELNNKSYREISFETAFSSIIFRWLNTDMQESEEEMASICQEIFSKL